jgi:pectate lyase
VGTVVSIVLVGPAAAAPPEDTFAPSPAGAAAEAGTTGADPANLRVVENLDDEGDGSLRAALEEPGGYIVFAVSGELVLSEPLEVPDDTTVDGRGARVELVGAGLHIPSDNVIVRNLIIRSDPDGDDEDLDAISVLGGASAVWVDHVDLSQFSDGLFDVTQESTGVTLSWSHLHDHDKAALIGAGSAGGTPEPVDVTIHHTVFERTGERNPLLRHGRFHIFNNVFIDWGYAEDSGYGLRASCGAVALVEGNVFRPGENPMGADIGQLVDCDPGRAEPAFVARDNLDGGADIDPDARADVVASDIPLTDVEPASPDLSARIEASAGWQDVPAVVDFQRLDDGPTDPPDAAGEVEESGPSDPVIFLLGAIVGGTFVAVALNLRGRALRSLRR